MDREKLMDLLFVNFNFYSKEYREEVADKIIALEKKECLSRVEIEEIICSFFDEDDLNLTLKTKILCIACTLSGKVSKFQEIDISVLDIMKTLRLNKVFLDDVRLRNLAIEIKKAIKNKPQEYCSHIGHRHGDMRDGKCIYCGLKVKPQECTCLHQGNLYFASDGCPVHGKLEWKKPSNLIDFNKQPEKPRKLEHFDISDIWDEITMTDKINELVDAINTINERIRGEG